MNNMARFYTLTGYIAIAYFGLLFVYPLMRVGMTSVWNGQEFTFDNYVYILTSSLYLDVLGRTLWVSVVSCIIALILGYSLAYFIFTRDINRQGIWLFIVIVPMFISLTVRLFGWMIVLSQGGPLVSLAGLVSDQADRFGWLFSNKAVIIGIVHYVVPFVVLSIYSSLKRIESSLLEASTMLGASRLLQFWTVIVPLSLPGVYAGLSIAFALSASTFLVPKMLGGPKDNLLANMAYEAIENIGNIGMGAALSIILLAIVVAVLSLLNLLERRHKIA